MTRTRGQALVEFLVAAGVLVALLLGTVLVARLHDVRAHAIQAARYAAFAQALGGTPTTELESEVRARFFGDPAVAMQAAHRTAGHATRTDANPHWVDLSRAANPLIAGPGDVVLLASNAAPRGAAANALRAATAAADGAAAITGRRLDLERRGLRTADVRVTLAPLPLPPASAPTTLVLSARSEVLGDDWGATGPAHVERRTGALVPSSPLRHLRPVFAPVAWALGTLEPSFRRLCLGHVDPEIVPADRLGPPGSGDAGSWRARCH
jgi:hypothetical protein